MAIDIALDDTHDIKLYNGDLALTQPKEQSIQEIKIRLQLWRGEWFLDITAGLPYLTEILQKRVNIDTVAALFKNEILAADGVTEILEFSIEYTSDRTMTISFKAASEEGPISLTQEISV